MTSFLYIGNNSVKISTNDKNFISFEIYTERAVEKCPRWNFKTQRKPSNSKNKSVKSITGHPVAKNLKQAANT